MTVTETMAPSEHMLKFLLERRVEGYRPTKEVVHTHNAGAMFQEFLRRMDERAKQLDVAVEPRRIEAQEAEVNEHVSPVLAQYDEPVENKGTEPTVHHRR
jgi:hypothetical protein